MNERIQQLAEQAEILITEVGAFHNTPQGAYQLKKQHMKKFAELIVRECLNTMENCDGDLDFAIWKTKEYFGVEL